MRCLILLAVIFNLIFAKEYNFKSIEEIKALANRGDAFYQGVLGEAYRRGDGVELNHQKALEFLKKSADQKDGIGLYNLAVMYQRGYEVKENKEKADSLNSLALVKLAEMAQKGNPYAQQNLCFMYLYGISTEKNEKKAFQLNKDALLQGHPFALRISNLYAKPGLGSGQDYQEIKEYLEEKAKSDDAVMYTLGHLYLNGIGTKVDLAKANECFRKVQKFNEAYLEKEVEDDFIIEGMLPPKYQLMIEEGSCGENCLWTFLKKKGTPKTQLEITLSVVGSARGIHTDELIEALKKFKIPFNNLERSVQCYDSVKTFARYKSFLYDEIIPKVQKGHPVIIGIKVYPTSFPDWSLDHFVTVVGYNKRTNELIYNDFTQRKRIKAEKLLNWDAGYSFLNKYDWVWAIEITDDFGNRE